VVKSRHYFEAEFNEELSNENFPPPFTIDTIDQINDYNSEKNDSTINIFDQNPFSTNHQAILKHNLKSSETKQNDISFIF
jgi:hypothetical protein